MINRLVTAGMVLFSSTFPSQSFSEATNEVEENQHCADVRKIVLKKIKSGATQKAVSRDVVDLMPTVQLGTKGDSCRNIRLAFHLMKQPAEGKVVLMKDWNDAIELLKKAN